MREEKFFFVILCCIQKYIYISKLIMDNAFKIIVVEACLPSIFFYFFLTNMCVLTYVATNLLFTLFVILEENEKSIWLD